jgi:hypothetical protein
MWMGRVERVLWMIKGRDSETSYFYRTVFPSSVLVKEEARLAGEIPVDQDPLDE